MTNTLAVCLLGALLCCSDLSLARQIPKECSKGPEYWCQSLRSAADCGAVGHCVDAVWQRQAVPVRRGPVSDKFVKLFNELKDVKDLINEDYLSTRVSSACQDASIGAASKICKENTAQLATYLSHVLSSDVRAETMCVIVGMCNNEKLDNLVELNKKKIGQSTDHKEHKQVLLGAEKCTWGPSYWCSNISTGHECKATRHCIDRVWSKMEVKNDTDSICKICTDMVTQARDQLESNETQEELKQVFEGSCMLIPLKLVRKECMKLADQFVPDLVETLASQMNPQTVCSVAGLCNNAEIDKMLVGYNEVLKQRTECHGCQRTVAGMRKRFDETSYETFLYNMLQACRKAGSLSDACSMLVFKYYENIVATLKSDLQPAGVCHVSGQCAYKYHQHDEYVFPNDLASDVEVNDDVPCEFCEQLVLHLRDVLVANTTEIEFFKVLKGLCKQTGNFKTECLSLVDQYYPVIYNYLVSDLKPKEICALMSVCPNGNTEPIAPLVDRELTVKAITPRKQLIGTDEANSYKMDKQESVVVLGSEPAPALPIERMFVSLPQSKAACSFCQYFLHYLQVELSDTNTEDRIKDVVDKACLRLPETVKDECQQFVTEYGPAVIALLVQEIDPASVCPGLGICPMTQEVKKVDINSGKSNCPLCLFAVEQLEAMLKNNRTETNIRTALDQLCNHLSTKLKTQCVDFVDQYTDQLVNMLISDMDAQQICVYLKLCTDNVADPLKLKGDTKPEPKLSAIDKFFERPEMQKDLNHFNKRKQAKEAEAKHVGGDIETNEIGDHTVNGRPLAPRSAKGICVICEFVLKEIDEQIKDKHNDDEIKKVVLGVCKHMPKTVKPDCDMFVEKYADLVISLLAQDLDPDTVCQELKLCRKPAGVAVEKAKLEILDCAICETVVMAVHKVLANEKVDRDVVHVVEKSCALLPAKYNDRCHLLLEIYGDSIIHLIEDFGTKGVCQKIGLCAARAGTYVDLMRGGR
ncbi:uncharacterized protein LOC105397196 isoform X3 [Plutella xylostella]|uniref:uncharacterized protein LOC105397196 isoform X1 n=1 Tax=Plutella xylostella TaxID=51655 RepID=UPI0020328759|nr:uncharacterized protein LOC105397196 isoform X1 [Plutella xylostella]XP_048480377.1 uncharacterized protein LOC105397196 isoform X2 [Plutella xylostella]XP_048480378.1 uncharacterized protein LOC105397196 isoform X3 [Plutella xylostella]